MIDRRTFLGTLASSLLAGPLAVEAQQTGRAHRLGFLGLTTAAALHDTNLAAFRGALRDHGYVEGASLLLEGRWADGRPERLPQLAKELVDLRVDVIVVATEPAA